MGCCGQKRRAWRDPGPKRLTSHDHRPPTLQNPTILYHLGDTALVVTGAATDITYLFGGRNSSLPVDERDLEALMALHQFSAAPPAD